MQAFIVTVKQCYSYMKLAILAKQELLPIVIGKVDKNAGGTCS
jgi:hypothetical protein